MKRPPIQPAEHVRLYEYYKNRLPNKLLAKFGHALLSVAIKPTITWEDDSYEKVAAHVQDGKQLLMFAKHSRKFDVLLPAVLVRHESALRPLIGNARILAHAGLFKNSLARRLFDGLGAIPVFRPAKIEKFGGKSVSGVTESLVDATQTCLGKGQTIVSFPEGGLQPDHPEVVGELGKGMIRLATEGEGVEDILSLAIGIAYTKSRFLRIPRAALHITPVDSLIGVPVEEASILVRDTMKQATLAAKDSLF